MSKEQEKIMQLEQDIKILNAKYDQLLEDIQYKQNKIECVYL